MILSLRYPHVRILVQHYAHQFSDQQIARILEHGLHSQDDAKYLSHFIWKMVDQMSIDREQKNIVLGGVDNTSMLPDVSYEMDTLMADSGYSEIWEKISEEA